MTPVGKIPRYGTRQTCQPKIWSGSNYLKGLAARRTKIYQFYLGLASLCFRPNQGKVFRRSKDCLYHLVKANFFSALFFFSIVAMIAWKEAPKLESAILWTQVTAPLPSGLSGVPTVRGGPGLGGRSFGLCWNSGQNDLHIEFQVLLLPCFHRKQTGAQ